MRKTRLLCGYPFHVHDCMMIVFRFPNSYNKSICFNTVAHPVWLATPTAVPLGPAKVCLLKLQYANPKRDTDQPIPTRAQEATYPANKQAKEEVACVGLIRSLEQFLRHMSVHYPAER
ncbi:hypothetical protein TNCV_818791 [Trichonephila clavipes]|nr:hypothetical protein TNCV_818791 [Trichonephila clavipes]